VTKKPRHDAALTDARLDLLRDLHLAADKIDDPDLFRRLQQRLEADILGLNAWRLFPQPVRWQRWLAVKQAHRNGAGAKLIDGPDGAFAVASAALKAANDPAGPSMIRRDYDKIEKRLAQHNQDLADGPQLAAERRTNQKVGPR
jgi:hypothetical protein